MSNHAPPRTARRLAAHGKKRAPENRKISHVRESHVKQRIERSTMNHRYVKGSAVAIGACTWALAASLTAPAVVFAAPTNLAQGKPVTVSRDASGKNTTTKLTDDDKTKGSRWSAEQNVPQ